MLFVEKKLQQKYSRSSSSASKRASSVPSTSQQQLHVTATGSGMRKTESSATTAIVSGSSASSQHHLAHSTEAIIESPTSIPEFSSSISSTCSSDEGHTKLRPSKTMLYHIKYEHFLFALIVVQKYSLVCLFMNNWQICNTYNTYMLFPLT